MSNLGNCKWPNCPCAPDACMFEKPEAYGDGRAAEARISGAAQALAQQVVLDRVWVVCYPKNEGILYHPPGKSAAEAWRNCYQFMITFSEFDEQVWGTAALNKRGFRARKVKVILDE